MSSSRLRSRDRQRLRAEANATVADLPIPYVLEAAAKQLDVIWGRFDVTVRDGLLLHVIRRERVFEVVDADGRRVREHGDEKIIPAGLWERPVRVSSRTVWNGYRKTVIKNRS